MGQTDSRTVVWGATLNRRRSRKKEFSEAQLSGMCAYLERQLEAIKGRINGLKENNGWQNEFNSLKPIGTDAPKTASCLQENTNKNRYTNVLAYDHSRVKLTPSRWNMNNDYINANFVPNHSSKPCPYIAAQGPVPDSIPDFWQMVVEQGVQLILMVTNEVEGGRLKCHRYWPEPDQEVVFGRYKITGKTETAHRTHIMRELVVTETDTGKHKPVRQLQYIGWPDHGVPGSAQDLLQLREEVYRHHDPATPLLVHCSAGVGRTGTYIAIDRLICAAENMEADLLPFEIVKDMRLARNILVQTLVQYAYVHMALFAAIENGLNTAKQALARLKANTSAMESELENVKGELATIQESVQGYQMDGLNAQVDGLRHKAEGDVLSSQTVADRLTNYMTQSRRASEASVPSQAPTVDADSVAERIKQLPGQMADTDFEQEYARAASQWQADDEYELGISLNPIESRKAVFASQKEAWQLRGEKFRQQVMDDSRQQVASLEARLKNLEDNLSHMEARTQEHVSTQRDRLRDETQNHTSLFERINSLARSNATANTFGRVVETPSKQKKKSKKQLAEEKAATERAAAAKAKAEAEEEERRKQAALKRIQEAEAARKAELAASPEPEIVEEVEQDHFLELKPAKPKAAEVHPMVAASQRSPSKTHPMLARRTSGGGLASHPMAKK